MALTGPAVPPRSGRAARQLVVFLHGLGADGNDLIGLAPYFAEQLPDAGFLSPHAPFACDMAPIGRQWFSMKERTPDALLRGLETARPLVDSFLDQALATSGLGDDSLALVGFSQGTMIALYIALRRKLPIASLVGFSGLLAAPERLAAELTARPPVLLIHGDQDPVVHFDMMAQASNALQRVQVPVTSLRCPGLGHSIDDAGLAAAIRFVDSGFAKMQA